MEQDRELLARIAALEAKVAELTPPKGYAEAKNYIRIGSGNRAVSVSMIWVMGYRSGWWRAISSTDRIIGDFPTCKEAVDAANKYLGPNGRGPL
jgi:hypothetical protein